MFERILRRTSYHLDFVPIPNIISTSQIRYRVVDLQQYRLTYCSLFEHLKSTLLGIRIYFIDISMVEIHANIDLQPLPTHSLTTSNRFECSQVQVVIDLLKKFCDLFQISTLSRVLHE